MRLADLFEEFLTDCRARRLSPKTVSWYASNLRYFREWLAAQGLGDDLAAYTLTNARRYSQTLAERTVLEATFVSEGGKRGVHALRETDRQLSPSSAIGYLRTLKTVSRWLAAEDQGYLSRDVLASLRLPKRPEVYVEPLTAGELPRRRRNLMVVPRLPGLVQFPGQDVGQAPQVVEPLAHQGRIWQTRRCRLVP